MCPNHVFFMLPVSCFNRVLTTLPLFQRSTRPAWPGGTQGRTDFATDVLAGLPEDLGTFDYVIFNYPHTGVPQQTTGAPGRSAQVDGA